jgi:hypothetical protein
MQDLKVKVAVLKEPTLSNTTPRTASTQTPNFEASLCL